MSLENKTREFLEKNANQLAISILILVLVGGFFLSSTPLVPSKAFLLFLLLAAFFSIGSFVLREILQVRELTRQTKNEFKESLRGESWKEPQFIRELTEKEKGKLASYNFLTKNFFLHPFRGILRILANITAVSLVTGYIYSLDKEHSFIFSFLSFFALFGSIITVVIIKGSRREKEIYKDMHLPVKQVCGKLTKQEDRATQDESARQLVVRGVKFSEQYNNIAYFWERYPEGLEVAVEYSPNTKKIWDIEIITNPITNPKGL